MDGYFQFCEKRIFPCFCSHLFESTTAVEHAGQMRGHFTMDGGSGKDVSLFFDHFFRWSHDAVFPRDLSLPPWLQSTPCAYADDFLVTASSFRTLMPLLLFVSLTGLLSIVQKRFCGWVADTCPDFGEMDISRVANYVGAMISPDGHLHRWTASRHKFVKVSRGIMESSTNLVEHLVDYKIYAFSVPRKHYGVHCCTWRGNPQAKISGFTTLGSWIIRRFSYTYVDGILWTGVRQRRTWGPHHESRDTIRKFKRHA